MEKNKNILEINKVTISFDGFKALNSLSLQIKKNQMIAIIGPNGAGKTTLQDAITGKTKINKGNIYFKSNDLSQFSEHEIVNLGIGRKFQRPTIIENISVWDNLCIALNTKKTFLSCLLYKLRNEDLTDETQPISCNSIILDLPDPQLLINWAEKSLLLGGKLSCYIPTINQVEDLLFELTEDEKINAAAFQKYFDEVYELKNTTPNSTAIVNLYQRLTHEK